MGPPANTCTVFRSNDLKIRGSLSKVRHLGSVRMVRVIADRSGFGCGYWSKSLFREFITVLHDVKMKTLVTLLLACCFGSAMAQSNLPLCQGNQTAWTDCFGRLTYPNGGKYVGEFKDDKKNGRGTNIYANGSKYVGEFKDNMRHGRGTETHPNGGKYVGEYKDDNKNGRGTDTYPNGDKNVGEYKDGNITQGTYFHLADNQFKGSKYVGEWKDNSINGQGTYTYANGDKYVGEFKDNKYNGQGTFTYANGDKYVGELKDDKLNGQGIKYLANGNVDKSGIWKDGVLVQSKFIDVATFTRIPTLSNSASNLAQLRKTEEQATAHSNLPECNGFKNNCFGTVIYGSDDREYGGGGKYVGEFKDGKYNGQGITFLANGKVDQSGIWKDGNLVQSKFIDVATFTKFQYLGPTTAQAPDGQTYAPVTGAASVFTQPDVRPQTEVERLREAAEQAKIEKAELEAQLAAAQQQAQLKPTAPVGPRLSVHAIVIGNGAYQGSGRLDNPINDARAMSAKLRQMGFKVTTIENATRSKLVRALVGFNRGASATDVSMFFYAGHAAQISGINYMLPTDINMNDLSEVPLHGISLNSVIDQYLPGKTKLVFLDACRDNPLLQVASRSMTRGLAPISVSEGVMIAYATKDGSVAADGNGKNSPFTKALLQHIDGPDDISVVLRKVRAEVMQDTDGKQQPWDYNSLTGGSLILSAIRAK